MTYAENTTVGPVDPPDHLASTLLTTAMSSSDWNQPPLLVILRNLTCVRSLSSDSVLEEYFPDDTDRRFVALAAADVKLRRRQRHRGEKL